MDGFSRLQLLIDDKITKINTKKVLIIGLGGVGGYALENIVRCGVLNITIVDGDIIENTNLNRQIIALNSTIGQYKVDAFEKRILDINPNCKIKKIKEFITDENIDLLFNDEIDYLIDACDTIKTKELIIKKCEEKDIKLISAMGTGNKLNPEKLKIMDLNKTSYDPIAKKLRKFVKDAKIKMKVMVVSSDEEKITTTKKVIPSISFVPAVSGTLLASYVINDILKEC